MSQEPHSTRAHFATIHERSTAVGLLNRRFLLEEIVYREFEAIKVVAAGPGYFAAATRHIVTAGCIDLEFLKFSQAGLEVKEYTEHIAIIHAPLAGSAEEVREEIALAFVGDHVSQEDHYLHELAARWEFGRGEEAAADAECDYQAAYDY